jgi:hypothetical protein
MEGLAKKVFFRHTREFQPLFQASSEDHPRSRAAGASPLRSSTADVVFHPPPGIVATADLPLPHCADH